MLSINRVYALESMLAQFKRMAVPAIHFQDKDKLATATLKGLCLQRMLDCEIAMESKSETDGMSETFLKLISLQNDLARTKLKLRSIYKDRAILL